MKKLILLSTLPLITASCATMEDSLKLGAAMGTVAGAAAAYAGHSSTGQQPSLETVAIGAGIGLGVGLLTSHIVHKSVESERQSFEFNQTEMHFGDLPPSPFIMPRPIMKKGGKR